MERANEDKPRANSKRQSALLGFVQGNATAIQLFETGRLWRGQVDEVVVWWFEMDVVGMGWSMETGK